MLEKYAKYLPGTFRYPVSAVIRDRKIASLAVFLKFVVFIYFLVMFFHNESYYDLHVPKVYGELTAAVGDFYDWEEKLLDGSAPDYCNDSSYNWVDPYEDYYKHIEATCVVPSFFEMFKSATSSIFYITYFHEAYVVDEPCENFTDAACAEDQLEYYIHRDILNRTCTCETIRNYFTVGVEDIELVLEHEYAVDALELEGSNADILSVIRDHTGVEVATHDGNDIAYKIGQWLTWAGIGLDDYNTNAYDFSGEHFTVDANATYPRIRQTGAKVLFDLKYYNTRAYQDEWRGSQTVCYIDVSAVQEWQVIGSDVRYIDYPSLPVEDGTGLLYTERMNMVNRYNYGLSFSVSGSGYIGEFDYAAIQAQLIDLLCLLGFVPAVVVLVAQYCFGFHSKIFRGQLKSEMDGEVKEMNHFRKVFKHVFKNYWSKSYVLTFDEWNKFCMDRSIPTDDAITIRQGCAYYSSKSMEKTVKLSAQMFWLHLKDPDSQCLKKWWSSWEEEYKKSEYEKFLVKRQNTHAGRAEDGKTRDGEHNSSNSISEVNGEEETLGGSGQIQMSEIQQKDRLIIKLEKEIEGYKKMLEDFQRRLTHVEQRLQGTSPKITRTKSGTTRF